MANGPTVLRLVQYILEEDKRSLVMLRDNFGTYKVRVISMFVKGGRKKKESRYFRFFLLLFFLSFSFNVYYPQPQGGIRL